MDRFLIVTARIIVGLLILLAICVCAIIVVRQEAWAPILNLNSDEAVRIGTSLSGILTPFLTAASSVLLYLALTKQIEANTDQKLKGDADIILLLLSQLEVELDNISNQTTNQTTTNGYYALLNISKNRTGNRHLKLDEYLYGSNGYKILILLKSFELVDKRISMSKLSKDYRDLFYFKLYHFYTLKLQTPLKNLISEIRECNEENHPQAQELILFYQDRSERAKDYIGLY